MNQLTTHIQHGDVLKRRMWAGDDLVLTAGIIDDDAIRFYRNGQCHALAVELHELTGLPVGIVVNDEGLHIHYVCLLDDENALDIGGVVPIETLTIIGAFEYRPRWILHIRDYSPRESADTEAAYDEAEYDLARVYACTVAEQYADHWRPRP